MSSSIKALALAFVLSTSQVLAASAQEPKVLSVKEFQQKIHSLKSERIILTSFEINNEELITLTKITGKKRMLASK